MESEHIFFTPDKRSKANFEKVNAYGGKLEEKTVRFTKVPFMREIDMEWALNYMLMAASTQVVGDLITSMGKESIIPQNSRSKANGNKTN